jgi:hypothetical protein
MMKNYYYLFVKTVLFFGLVLMTGCQPVITLPEGTTLPTSPAEDVTLIATDNMYPSSPEEVIRSFLIAYPLDQIYAVQYLSPSYVQKLDAGSVAKLLPASGEITGFIIENGATSSESEKSEILTNIAFNDSSYDILFNLEIVDGRWAISNISVK